MQKAPWQLVPQGRRSWKYRLFWTLLFIALLLVPTFWEELQLALLPGRWVLVQRGWGTYPSGQTWRVSGGSNFLSLTLRSSVVWTGDCDEVFGSLWIYRDQASPVPRFLCYQPLTSGPHTSPVDVRHGIWLIEGESCRPLVTNTPSQFLRNPGALLGYRQDVRILALP